RRRRSLRSGRRGPRRRGAAAGRTRRCSRAAGRRVVVSAVDRRGTGTARGDSTAAGDRGSSYFITSGVWATTAFFSVTNLTTYAGPLGRPSFLANGRAALRPGSLGSKPLIRLLAASFLPFQNSIVSSVAPALVRNAV